MKLKCNQVDLSLALSLVNRAVSPNTTLPVLNNILLKAEGKKLFLCATNLEIAISAAFEADIENEGALTVPAKVLTAYVSLLEDKETRLSVLNGNTLNVQSKGSNTKVKGISGEEFPLLPKLENPDVFKFPVKPFLDALSMVTFAASTNISRPILTGIYWQISGNTVKLAATDSYRLAEKKIVLEKDQNLDLNFLLPSRTAVELEKILSSAVEPEFEIRIAKGQALFKVDGVELMSRLLEGNFPDYEKILPKESKTTALIQKEEFILALKKISVIIRENNNNVKVKVQRGEVAISSDETQVGQGAFEVPAEVSGETVETALNAQYLLDVLAHLNGATINLGLNDSIAPVMVGAASAGDYLHIIMPLKV
ncbi:MAG: DNA polymerase III subunit beta [Candidatus Gracilibacteria bacterium]|jgi:DNA polymerase-3 subunit beta